LLACLVSPAGDDFTAAIVPAARAVQADYGVPAAVTIAVAIHESDSGTSALARGNRNYFGIKCPADPASFAIGCARLPTGECCDAEGHFFQVKARFRVYPSLEASVLDYGHFLRDRPRYAAAFQYADDPDRFIQAVAAAGYATDPDYAAKVIAVMRQYDL